MEKNKEEGKGFSLRLEEKFLYIKDKKGREVVMKNEKGEPNYLRNDVMGMMGLLNKFNSTLHTMKDYKQWIKIKDKIRDCFVRETNILELSLDEAAFLKDFLINLTEKDAKSVQLVEFEIRSLTGIVDQFTE
jgi:hypothetical protein